MQPDKNGDCIICGGELCRREDDDPITLKKRIKIYNENLEKILSMIQSKNINCFIFDYTDDDITSAANILIDWINNEKNITTS